jgi:endonuclease-3
LVENRPSNIKKKDWYVIPDSIEWLTELPWVWIKTAKVVLHCLYWKAYIAADTHVHRVANRLWLTNTKTPEKTSEKLEEIIPKKYKWIAHHSLILFGRYHCTARNPKCSDCPFVSRCPSKII